MTDSRHSYVDLHLHSVYSDGSFTPGEIVSDAEKKGLSALILTDHDTTEGTSLMLKACAQAGIRTIPGIEISCTWKDKSIHILGYGMDYRNGHFQKQLAEWQGDRERRNRAITEKLRKGGYDISMKQLHAHFPGAILTRAHIAVYMAEKQMVPDKNAVFSSLIGKGCPYYVPRKPIPPGDAVRFLLSHGGVPVFVHPILTRMTPEMLDSFTGYLAELGLKGMEGYYSGYTVEDEALVAEIAAKYGLILTGGSDFHGTAKPSISIGTGKGGLRVPFSCYESLISMTGNRS